MPSEPISEIPKFRNFLSGLFWPFSILKTHLGTGDFSSNFSIISSFFRLRVQVLSESLGDHRAAVLRYYGIIGLSACGIIIIFFKATPRRRRLQFSGKSFHRF